MKSIALVDLHHIDHISGVFRDELPKSRDTLAAAKNSGKKQKKSEEGAQPIWVWVALAVAIFLICVLIYNLINNLETSAASSPSPSPALSECNLGWYDNQSGSRSGKPAWKIHSRPSLGQNHSRRGFD